MINVNQGNRTPEPGQPSWNAFSISPKVEDDYYMLGEQYGVVFHKIFTGKLTMHQFPIPAKGYSYRLFKDVDELRERFTISDSDAEYLESYMKKKRRVDK